MMFSLLFSIAALALTTAAPTPDSDMYVVPNDTSECTRDLINWCAGMKYPQEGAGVSMLSINTRTRRDGYIRVFCKSDPDGSNCTKNGQPWFACSKDNKFTYEGREVDPDDINWDNSNDGICETAELAFNNIMVQDLSYDNETVAKAIENGMEGFFESMADMREEIENLSRRLSEIFPPRPWIPDFWGGSDFFGGGRRYYYPYYPYEIEREN